MASELYNEQTYVFHVGIPDDIEPGKWLERATDVLRRVGLLDPEDCNGHVLSMERVGGYAIFNVDTQTLMDDTTFWDTAAAEAAMLKIERELDGKCDIELLALVPVEYTPYGDEFEAGNVISVDGPIMEGV